MRRSLKRELMNFWGKAGGQRKVKCKDSNPSKSPLGCLSCSKASSNKRAGVAYARRPGVRDELGEGGHDYWATVGLLGFAINKKRNGICAE